MGLLINETGCLRQYWRHEIVIFAFIGPWVENNSGIRKYILTIFVEMKYKGNYLSGSFQAPEISDILGRK
jgi:hypothetical protein